MASAILTDNPEKYSHHQSKERQTVTCTLNHNLLTVIVYTVNHSRGSMQMQHLLEWMSLADQPSSDCSFTCEAIILTTTHLWYTHMICPLHSHYTYQKTYYALAIHCMLYMHIWLNYSRCYLNFSLVNHCMHRPNPQAKMSYNQI